MRQDITHFQSFSFLSLRCLLLMMMLQHLQELQAICLFKKFNSCYKIGLYCNLINDKVLQFLRFDSITHYYGFLMQQLVIE